MRLTGLPIVIAVVALLASVLKGNQAAYATLLFSESFDVATGELGGSAGSGTGFSGTWTADAAFTEVTAGGLSYSVVGGGTINGGSASLSLSGSDAATPTATRDLTVPFTGDVIYVRFLFSVGAGGALNDGDVILASLRSGTTSDTANRLGVRGTSTNDFFIDPLSGGAPSEVNFGGNAAALTTYLVIGRFTKLTGGAANAYDQAQLWVNPEFGDAGSPDVTSVTESSAVPSISTLILRIANAEVPDNLLIDEIAAGTEWTDVVPVPEPSTLALLTCGGVGALFGFVRRTPQANWKL